MALTQVDGGLLSPTNAQYTGFKNRIINGAMGIAQRGTTATNSGTTSSAAYSTVDRWQVWFFGALNGASPSQQTSGGPNNGFPNFLRVQRVAANTNTSILAAAQSVETVNCRDVAGGTVTFSFWARAGSNFSSASNILITTINFGTGTDGNLWNGFTTPTNIASNITLTTSWQYFTVTSSVPSSNTQLGVLFGYTPVGTAGANDYFDITGVQLEKGSTATSFDYRPYGTELALCQRYYTRLTTGGSAPFAAFGNGTVINSTQGQGFVVKLPVPMRIAPTPTLSNCRVYDGSGASSVTSISSVTQSTCPTALGFDLAVANAFLTAYRPGTLQGDNNTAAYIEANSEL